MTRPGTPALPTGWTLAASAFNWTNEIVRAERLAGDLVVGICADGIADVIEIEPGQLWRSFPRPSDRDVDDFRERLEAAGGRVSIAGISIDQFGPDGTPRDEDERLAFVLPQLRAAHRVGAAGVRLPLGQAGRSLHTRLQPVLHDLDLTLFEELQGQQTGMHPAVDAIADLDDERVRLLVDVSMLMPALPPTYLDRLRSGGIPASLLDRLTDDWRAADTAEAVLEVLRAGAVLPAVHLLYMDLLIRFGRSTVADLHGIVGLVGAYHLKFWDLDDADGRITSPLRELGALLARTGFRGTLTSEWGGHEWLGDWDAGSVTRAHLALAGAALAEGVGSVGA